MIDRKTGRQKDRQTLMDGHRHREMQTDRQTERQRYSCNINTKLQRVQLNLPV